MKAWMSLGGPYSADLNFHILISAYVRGSCEAEELEHVKCWDSLVSVHRYCPC